jgi:PD-(D/E)XK endonuclease
LSSHSRADLVLEIGTRLYRVQVKWGRLNPSGDVVQVRVGGNYLTANGYVRSSYSEDEIDLLAIYCGALDRCFLLPVDIVAGLHSIQLRLTPPRNNQQACINLADEYDFAGAVAQLGERRAGSAKVRGSSPLSSTSSSSLEPAPISVGSNPFRDRLCYWMDVVAAGQEVIVTRRGRPRLRLTSARGPS